MGVPTPPLKDLSTIVFSWDLIQTHDVGDLATSSRSVEHLNVSARLGCCLEGAEPHCLIGHGKGSLRRSAATAARVIPPLTRQRDVMVLPLRGRFWKGSHLRANSRPSNVCWTDRAATGPSES